MRRLGVAVLALGLGAGAGSAQELIRSRLQQVVVLPNAKADALRWQAEMLYDQRSYRRAAGLHEREAELRSPYDPERIKALAQAARLYSYLGDAGRARQLMLRSARSALQRGDVTRAAQDAALLAMRERHLNLGLDLARQAELLSESPLLSEADRNAILRRIDPARGN